MKRPGPFRADEHVTEGLAPCREGAKIGNAQIDVHRPVDVGLAANRRCRAVRAPCWQTRRNRPDSRRARSRPRRCAIAQRRGDAGLVLHEAFELDLVAKGDVRKRARAILQDRVEPGLRARPPALRAEHGIGALAERRRADASDLVALHVGDEGAVERPVERETPVAHLFGDAELPAELHGADAHFEHLGGAELVLVALDQHAATPRRPRSAASASPIGPPPAISTGVSTVEMRSVMSRSCILARTNPTGLLPMNSTDEAHKSSSTC